MPPSNRSSFSVSHRTCTGSPMAKYDISRTRYPGDQCQLGISPSPSRDPSIFNKSWRLLGLFLFHLLELLLV